MGVGFLGLGASCLLGVIPTMVGVGVGRIGVGGGVLEVVLSLDFVGVVEAQSHIFGSMPVLSQDGDRGRFSMVSMVGRLACAVWPSGLSGLSLALFRALPGGGLTPKVGGVVIFLS